MAATRTYQARNIKIKNMEPHFCHLWLVEETMEFRLHESARTRIRKRCSYLDIACVLACKCNIFNTWDTFVIHVDNQKDCYDKLLISHSNWQDCVRAFWLYSSFFQCLRTCHPGAMAPLSHSLCPNGTISLRAFSRTAVPRTKICLVLFCQNQDNVNLLCLSA